MFVLFCESQPLGLALFTPKIIYTFYFLSFLYIPKKPSSFQSLTHVGKGGGSLPRSRKQQRPLQIPLNRSLSQGARDGGRRGGQGGQGGGQGGGHTGHGGHGGGGVEWRITTATPELDSPLSTPGGGFRRRGRGKSRDGPQQQLSPGGQSVGDGRRRVATSPGMGKGSPPGGGKGGKGGNRRRKSLITTEFSPAEWNINNLNKYKK